MNTRIVNNIVRRFSTKPKTNGEIQPFIYNRNPRNLERLRIERKPTGYHLEKNFISFWHKVEVIKFSYYVVAQLIHNTDKVVVQASTNEWALKKQLYSMNDSMAYITLGKVFAERCLECGLTSFACPYKISSDDKSKLNLFLNALKNEGLRLEEPDVYNVHAIWFKDKEKKPWTVLED